MISTEELGSLVECLTSVLSELESEVLTCYLDGRSYEEIAERLACDTKTVDNALQRVKRKVSIAPRLARGPALAAQALGFVRSPFANTTGGRAAAFGPRRR